MGTIQELQQRIGEINAANGWRTTNEAELDDKARVNAQVTRLALITTEVAEAIEEVRNGHAVDEAYYSWSPLRIGDSGWQVGKPIIAWCETCAWGISENQVEPALSNGSRTPQQVAEGHVSVSGLNDGHEVRWASKIKPEGVPSELADIVIRALDAAGAWGIDLEAIIDEKLAYNITRGHRHGGKAV